MGLRFACGAVGAAVLSCSIPLFAQTSATTRSDAPRASSKETPVTLVGCIQRESDYRKQHHSGKGGPVGTGAGLADEFVLVSASPAGAANVSGSCDGASGEAYELSGPGEDHLKPFVGRRVQISGTMKDTKITAEGKTAGGFDPLGQDLRLREVNVISYQEAPAASAATTRSEPSGSEPQATSGVRQESQTASASSAQRLPGTASPVPLAGLIGFASLGASFGLRALRRATGR